MDPIISSDSDKVIPTYSAPVKLSPKVKPLSEQGTSVSLTDLSSLTNEAMKGEALRPDAIERAKQLLSDPNWPNDGDIEKLSEKLLSIEDFG